MANMRGTMRTLGITGLLLLIFIGAGSAWADLLPPHMHNLDRCASIRWTNLYPDLVLVAVDVHPSGETYAYRVQEGECLQLAYKMDELTVYGVSAKDFARLGPDAALELPAEQGWKLDLWGGPVEDGDPRTSERREYRVDDWTPSIGLTLQRVGVTTYFLDGSSSTETQD